MTERTDHVMSREGPASIVAAPGLIVDLFAGPGGWSEGLRMLGLASHEVGIEWDEWACRTRVAAGHRVVRADVSQYPTAPFVGRTWGLIASPPCPDWSLAGSGLGREGNSGHLVDEVMRWAEALRPTWLACEQVPGALPVWREFAHRLKADGYSTWTGVLNAADFGVPQTRERAILLASLERQLSPPLPTHSPSSDPVLFGDQPAPWVTMAEAIGWGIIDEPAGTVLANSSRQGASSPLDGGSGSREKYRRAKRQGRWLDRRQTGAPVVDITRNPCPTITCAAFGKGVWKITDDAGVSIQITEAEALTLQGFRPDYPVQGPTLKIRHGQIGNAVPPPLAMHALATVTGLNVPSGAAEVAA